MFISGCLSLCLAFGQISPTITAKDINTHFKALSSNAERGGTGNYIAQQFADLDLKPAGDNSTFNQILPISSTEKSENQRELPSNILARLSCGIANAQTLVIGTKNHESGITGLLEIAQYLIHLKSKGKLPLKRDILFAVWSGDTGSADFVKSQLKHPHDTLYPRFSSYLEIGNIGRYDQQLIAQGVASSNHWKGEIERRNAPLGLNILVQQESSSTSFYRYGVPVLGIFVEKNKKKQDFNTSGMIKISKFIALVGRSLAINSKAPDYVDFRTVKKNPGKKGHIYLGTIPNYSSKGIKGLKLDGATKDGPAEKAGVLPGDIIIHFAGKPIEDVYSFMNVLETLKPNIDVKMIIKRGDKVIELMITPIMRD